jgi:hypothetical protein
MTRTNKKVRNANNSNSQDTDASLLLAAICDAVRTKRETLATKLVEIAENGNSTMLKAIIDLVTQSAPPEETSRLEGLKNLSKIENEPDYGVELSEDTAEGYPSGREPD